MGLFSGLGGGGFLLAAIGPSADFGDWLCKMLGICA